MTSVSRLHGPARTTVRRVLTGVLAVVVACLGVALWSSSSAHKAGAAVNQPRAIAGGVTLSLAVTGITGEGGSGGTGSIEVNSFQWGVSRGTSAGSASAGKAKFAGFTVTKLIDSTSPTFFQSCAAGKHYKTVTLSIRRAGDVASTVTYTLSTAFVTDVSWSGDNAGDAPSESVTFTAKSYSLKYIIGIIGR
jgi:type VI secretion system secreted protein Hcp